MPNYNVKYVAPAGMLLSLRDELNAVMPNRFTGTDGFITGYGQYGRSSHNPNNHGHVMAFDISTPADGQNITEHMGRSLADHLRTKVNENFKYLIHDMSAGAPAGKIAGDFSNWEWRIYGGDAHSNHIHISLTNDYLWGDDCGLSPEIYNRRVNWGIAGWYAAYTGKAAAKPAPAPAPAPTPPAPAPAPSFGPVNRTVTNPVAYARTAPNSSAPVAVEVAQGAPLAVIGYVGGQDPYGTGDNAWYKTKSGFYVWANAASNDISGLPFLGNMG